jgi:hypothetical protein
VARLSQPQQPRRVHRTGSAVIRTGGQTGSVRRSALAGADSDDYEASLDQSLYFLKK